MKGEKITEIHAEDLVEIALGGAFLGTGGGGDPYIGRLVAEANIRKYGPVQVIQPEDLADDALVLPVAMMGAPTVLVEKLFSEHEALEALRAFEAYAGRKADAIFCAEVGGMNSTTPIAVAAQVGLPVVDADGMGRAFPELQIISMTMHGIKATPLVATDEKGNSIVLNAIDNHWTEKLARAALVEMGGRAMTVLYPMTGAETKRAALKGSMSLIKTIGRTIKEEQAAHRNPAHRLARELGGFRLFEGRIQDVERRTEGGFARGKCVLNGLEKDTGDTLTIEFQNEFLFATRSDGTPAAMTPDLICLLDLETGEPITTEQIRFGLRALVFGLKCDPQWRSEMGLHLAGPRYFKYDHDYCPIEDLNA